MKKVFLSIFISLFIISAFAQTNSYTRADTIHLTNTAKNTTVLIDGKLRVLRATAGSGTDSVYSKGSDGFVHLIKVTSGSFINNSTTLQTGATFNIKYGRADSTFVIGHLTDTTRRAFTVERLVSGVGVTSKFASTLFPGAIITASDGINPTVGMGVRINFEPFFTPDNGATNFNIWNDHRWTHDFGDSTFVLKGKSGPDSLHTSVNAKMLQLSNSHITYAVGNIASRYGSELSVRDPNSVYNGLFFYGPDGYIEIFQENSTGHFKGFEVDSAKALFTNTIDGAPLTTNADTAQMSTTPTAFVTNEWVLGHLPSGGGGGITNLTGDGTAAGPGSAALTLATVNSSPGTFGDATHVPTVTVNGKGLATTVTSTAITFPVTASNSVTFTNKSGNISQWTNDSGYITSAPTAANPTASVGGSPVNGSAITFMRSDAAPKADTSILQTILNLFPKTDTRYYTKTASDARYEVPLTFTSGLTRTSNTVKADTSVLQTVLNFFPKGDTRYAKISALPAGANPTASAGTTAVNGSATTFMRSDAAPKVDSTAFTTKALISTYLTKAQILALGYITGNQTISFAPTGDVTGSTTGTTSLTPVLSISNSAVIGKVLTGYTSGAGTVTSTDNILQAIQKLNGNITAKVNISDTSAMLSNYIPRLVNSTIPTIKTFTKAPIFQQNSIATTLTDGAFLQNNTASTSGVPVQQSPSLHFGAQVWNTTATAANNFADGVIYIKPVSGSTPSSVMTFGLSRTTSSTPSYLTNMTLDNLGNLVLSDGTHTGASFSAGTGLTISDAGGIAIGGSQISMANNLFTIGTTSGNFYLPNASFTNNMTNASLLFGGASNVAARIMMMGTGSAVPAVNGSSAAYIIGTEDVTRAASGTHALFAQFVGKPLTVSGAGAATITNTATFFGQGASTATVTGKNYDAWFIGQNRMSGLQVDTLTASKVVFTDASKNLTSTGIGTSSQYIAGDGSLATIGSKPHVIFTPTTGGTVALTNNQYNIINPAGALLALTVNLPSSPANNDCVFIKFTQNVTTVTYSGGTVVDGITAPTAGGLTVLTYDSASTSWY